MIIGERFLDRGELSWTGRAGRALLTRDRLLSVGLKVSTFSTVTPTILTDTIPTSLSLVSTGCSSTFNVLNFGLGETEGAGLGDV